MEQQEEQFQEWAVVELFGHAQIAGLVSSQTIGGDSFIRVDVPAEEGDGWKYTKLYGKGAIYSMTFCSEDTARVAAARLDIRPVTPWVVPDRRALPTPDRANLSYEDEWGDEGDEE